MSSANRLFERKGAFEQYTKTITSGDYTVRVGSVANNFIVDRVVKITTTTDDDDTTITVPNGVYSGQRILIILTDVGHDETVTITPDTGDSVALGDDGDYWSAEYVDSTTGWQTIHSEAD